MYGQECLAVTVDDVISSTWAIATLLAEYNAEAEEKIPEPKGMRYDNMGRSYVIYWTRVPYVEDESHPMSGALWFVSPVTVPVIFVLSWYQQYCIQKVILLLERLNKVLGRITQAGKPTEEKCRFFIGLKGPLFQ
jgi:hypothetical protein